MNDKIKGIELAKMMNLQTLINYQEGAVVSKTLIDKNVGTITIFAFDEGQGLSEHTAPYDALVYIFDGKAQITISKKEFLLEKDQFIIMPANEPHALKAVKRYKMMLIMIRS